MKKELKKFLEGKRMQNLKNIESVSRNDLFSYIETANTDESLIDTNS